MAKTHNPPPKPPPAIPGGIPYGIVGPAPAAASVPAAPNYLPDDVAFRAGDAPANPPHSQRLQIVRARGGYIMFAADEDFDQADADPADAVAVASTPQELLRRVGAWAQAKPRESFPA